MHRALRDGFWYQAGRQMSTPGNERAHIFKEDQGGISANASLSSGSFREQVKDGLSTTYREMDEFRNLPASSRRYWKIISRVGEEGSVMNTSIVK